MRSLGSEYLSARQNAPHDVRAPTPGDGRTAHERAYAESIGVYAVASATWGAVMIKRRGDRLAGFVAIAALALVVAMLAGCAKSSSTTSTKSGTTALDNLSVAESSLSTTAPDAKLLVVQTSQATTPTVTPIWAYLFGSPSTDKTYLVYATAGKSMGANAYGTAGLTKAQWKQVPGVSDWKIDSDVAYSKALAVSGAKGAPTQYFMYFLTYKPKTDTSTVDAYMWNVQFNPGTSGATTSTIGVDLKSGTTKIYK